MSRFVLGNCIDVMTRIPDTGGNKRQVPAKRQNRGSRNSTDDGG
ncbi:Uncharacterised protein [Escherichia coli]|nr:Uncharacterised protein [Escherichia coli]